MPRPLLIALVATLCFTFTARAEDKPSPAVKRILDKAVGKVRANRTEFEKANKKPLDEARQELQDLSTKLIKDGKTEEAKAVLGQVGTLEADVMREANAPPLPPAPVNVMADLRAKHERGAEIVKTLCATRWKHLNSWTYSFTSDGKFSLEGTGRHGTYVLTEDAKTVILRWENEGMHTAIAVGGKEEEWKFGDGLPFRPERIGPE